ncbi:hypothetical protein ABPG75_013471 [Micractinium tetrahymenae]
MDITGFRSRSTTGLMQAVSGVPSGFAAQRRHGGRKQASLSTGAKALLLVVLLGLAWLGIRRAGHKQAASSAGAEVTALADDHAAQGGSSGATAGGGQAAAASGQQAAATGGSGASAQGTKAAGRMEQALLARIERSMRLVPAYRGPGKAETWPFFGNANRLLLASHGRLLWYRYDTDELKVLQEGEGKRLFYGVFTGSERGVLGEPTSLWAVAAPFSKQQQQGADAAKEWLLHLDAESGRELGRVQLPSKFTHDAVRRRDRVYVANTGEGRVLELSFPAMDAHLTPPSPPATLPCPSALRVRELPLFSEEEHVNTLAPTHDGKLWALLHNLGASQLVEVDLTSGKELQRIGGIGAKAHGLTFWQNKVLTLDSEGGALVAVDTGKDPGSTGQVEKLWQVAEPGKYLKGLCVVDDVAFFGIAPSAPRDRRADASANCELAAFDLQQRLLLWRRQLPTRGLLNVVAAPHLTVESTTYATSTRPLISYRDKSQFAEAVEAARNWALQQEREAQGAHAAQAVQQQQAQQGERVQAAQQEQQTEQAAQQAQAQQLQQQQQQQQQQQDTQQQAQAHEAHTQQEELGQAAQGTEAAQQAQGTEAAPQAQAQEQAQAQQHQAQAQEAQQHQAQAQEAQQHQAQAQEAQQHQAQAQEAQQHQAQAQEAQQQQQQQQDQEQRHEGRHVAMHQGEQQAALTSGQATAPVVRALSEVDELPASDSLAKYPPLLDSTRWSSGLPRLLASAKSRGLSSGAQLRLLRADVAPLKALLGTLEEADWREERHRASNAWLSGREENLRELKPGAQAIMLLFSDQDGAEVFRFPWYDRFKEAVEPLLLQILGPRDVANILRLQLARMAPRSELKQHVDTGGYAERGHRIHLVLQTNPGVSFLVCDTPENAASESGPVVPDSLPCLPIHVEVGLAFELNNRLPHRVMNGGDQERIHLLIDVAESPRQPRQLRVGELCEYGQRIVCPRPPAEGAADEAAQAAGDGGAHGGGGLR